MTFYNDCDCMETGECSCDEMSCLCECECLDCVGDNNCGCNDENCSCKSIESEDNEDSPCSCGGNCKCGGIE
jgi:hypothetical protein